MPLYTYACDQHGEFSAWGKMSESDQPQPCPACAEPAPRALAHPAVAGGGAASAGAGERRRRPAATLRPRLHALSGPPVARRLPVRRCASRRADWVPSATAASAVAHRRPVTPMRFPAAASQATIASSDRCRRFAPFGSLHLPFDQPDVPTAEAFALERLPWLRLTGD